MRYKVDKVKNFSETRGWLCGHFMPKDSPLNNSELEVKYEVMQPGDIHSLHYHPQGTEVCIIVKGKAK